MRTSCRRSSTSRRFPALHGPSRFNNPQERAFWVVDELAPDVPTPALMVPDAGAAAEAGGARVGNHSQILTRSSPFRTEPVLRTRRSHEGAGLPHYARQPADPS